MISSFVRSFVRSLAIHPYRSPQQTKRTEIKPNENLQANHFNSLLPRFLGLFSIRRAVGSGHLKRGKAETIVVMNNVFFRPTPHKTVNSVPSTNNDDQDDDHDHLEEVYDLKGSTHHRFVTQSERERGGQRVLKDVRKKKPSIQTNWLISIASLDVSHSLRFLGNEQYR